MNIEIISPSKKLFSGDAVSITVPSSNGTFTVLKNHAPIVAVLKRGKIWITVPSGTKSNIDILGGIIEIHNNKVVACVEIED